MCSEQLNNTILQIQGWPVEINDTVTTHIPWLQGQLKKVYHL